MRVLVTGATGFTGWHAARRLRTSGHEVRALVRSEGKAERLLPGIGIPATEWVVGDMTDPAAVARGLEGCDAVLHAAAAVNVRVAGAGDDAFAANVEGTRRVVGAACEAGKAAVLFVSSLTAIFDPGGGEVTPDSPLVECSTRYGRSKALSDAFVRGLQAQGAPISIVYPSAIIGPDDPGRSESMSAFRGFVGTMLDSAGGTAFVDVRDLAILFERLLDGRVGGRHVAAGSYFGWPDLIEAITEVTGARIRRLRAPAAVLRGVGSLLDVVGRVSGASFPMTREAMEIATRWRDIADSSSIAELGVRWRDPRETLADTYRWLLDVGALPAKAVPRLSGASSAAAVS